VSLFVVFASFTYSRVHRKKIFQGRRQRKKTQYRKIAPLSFFLLYQNHVWKSRRARLSLPPSIDALSATPNNIQTNFVFKLNFWILIKILFLYWTKINETRLSNALCFYPFLYELLWLNDGTKHKNVRLVIGRLVFDSLAESDQKYLKSLYSQLPFLTFSIKGIVWCEMKPASVLALRG